MGETVSFRFGSEFSSAEEDERVNVLLIHEDQRVNVLLIHCHLNSHSVMLMVDKEHYLSVLWSGRGLRVLVGCQLNHSPNTMKVKGWLSLRLVIILLYLALLIPSPIYDSHRFPSYIYM